jgi:hypothetical protein
MRRHYPFIAGGPTNNLPKTSTVVRSFPVARDVPRAGNRDSESPIVRMVPPWCSYCTLMYTIPSGVMQNFDDFRDPSWTQRWLDMESTHLKALGNAHVVV